MKPRSLVVASLLGLVAVTFAGVCVRAVSVKTVVAAPGPVRSTVVALAEVVPKGGLADVRPEAPGRVLRVLVREGDRVTKGQLLAELDDRVSRAMVSRLTAEHAALSSTAQAVARGSRREEKAAAAAELRAAQHGLSLAQDRLTRVKKLMETGATTESAEVEANEALEMARARLDHAQAQKALADAGGRAEDVATARAKVAAASAAIEEASRMMDHTRIESPIDGVIVTRRIDEGDTVITHESAPPAFEVADDTKLEIAAEVEEPDSIGLEVGLGAAVKTLGGRTLVGHARVTRVAPKLKKRNIGADDARLRAETLVRTVWLDVDPGGPSLPLGKRVEVVVDMPPHQALAVVPRSAVEVRGGLARVEVPFGPLPLSRVVGLGAADEENVEVLGLPAGTKVVAAR